MKTDRRIHGTNHDSTEPIRLEPKLTNPRPAFAPLWWIITTLGMSAIVWACLNLIHP